MVARRRRNLRAENFAKYLVDNLKEEYLIFLPETIGFFSPGSSRFRYLGIWYHKVREQTVVWVANRNHPINDSSGVLSIDRYGNLILYSNHNQKVPVWSTNVSVEVTDTCVAQLLDTGNLILVQDRSKRVVWESFDHPTDTLLPGMKLGFNRRRGIYRFPISWRSADDPGTGNFSIQINRKGSPQVFLYWGTKHVWRGFVWPLKSDAGGSNVSFVNNQDEIYAAYFLSDASIILRVVVDYSGLLKKLTWHEKDGKWKEIWLAPISGCHTYGYCGTYGQCDPDVIRRFECECLPGYKPKSPRDWQLRDGSGGCVRKRLESTLVCGHEEGFVKVAHVKVPDTSAAAWVSMNMSPRDCEKECRRNCSCSAYASIEISGEGTGCLTWYGKLMDTVHNMEEGYDIYVRVDAVELAEIAQKSNGFLRRKDTLAILVVSVVSAWLVVILFAYLWLKKKKKKRVRNTWSEIWLNTIGSSYKETSVQNEVEDSMSHPDIAFFNLSTILAATNNFSPANRLGQGGFGVGKLSNGKEVAVKRLSKNSAQGIEEFKNEVLLIAKLQHQNLVKLRACCIQGEEPMLVYEYMPNKSLDSFLFDMAFMERKRAWQIVDSSLKESCSPHEVLRCIHIGLLCVQEDVLERPTMSAVILMLSSEIDLPSPKQPAFIFSSLLATKERFYSVDEEAITEVACR
ncbi:hypothetical protein GH714_003538 [Hevea brasiliensis]|uniref:non-specific serine/threonine protein kinase n=1 Tax=Hevea brasiliensis TaxID=3981 RepID=A0A6A6MYQ2_HEVBR|nr:hypothetical protein GH714_003538 [Hevea brasiliensis]